MIQKIGNSGKEFYLCLMEKEDIEEVLQLCDQCVGQNLYQKEELAKTIGSNERWFLLLKTSEGELAGYIYYYLTAAEYIAEDARLSIEKIRHVCRREAAPVGKIQSIGVKEKFRRQGLAVHMLQYALDGLSEKGIEEVFIVCWNAGGRVPLAKALQACRFSHLSSAKMIWYDKEDLFCPYCKGRCRCDAEVYYKKVCN